MVCGACSRVSVDCLACDRGKVAGIADIEAGRCAPVAEVRERLLSRYEPSRAIESLAEMPSRYPLSRNPALAALDCHQFTVGNFNIVCRIDEMAQAVNVVAIAYFRRLTDFVAGRVEWREAVRDVPAGHGQYETCNHLTLDSRFPVSPY